MDSKIEQGGSTTMDTIMDRTLDVTLPPFATRTMVALSSAAVVAVWAELICRI